MSRIWFLAFLVSDCKIGFRDEITETLVVCRNALGIEAKESTTSNSLERVMYLATRVVTIRSQEERNDH